MENMCLQAALCVVERPKSRLTTTIHHYCVLWSHTLSLVYTLINDLEKDEWQDFINVKQT